jgi:hypothetical protein
MREYWTTYFALLCTIILGSFATIRGRERYEPAVQLGDKNSKNCDNWLSGVVIAPFLRVLRRFAIDSLASCNVSSHAVEVLDVDTFIYGKLVENLSPISEILPGFCQALVFKTPCRV